MMNFLRARCRTQDIAKRVQGRYNSVMRQGPKDTSLNIPFPGFNAPFIASLEFVGGILIMLGLFSRPIAFLLACNMFVAYWTADREALTAIFSDPGKFYVADPYTFLFASLMILIFGAGLFSIDTLISKRIQVTE
jgi:putative oxidoreductase